MDLELEIDRCTRCGLCNEVCSTYQASGWESESPRGRIHLAGEVLAGRIDPASETLDTFDRCLGCRRCEAFCPLGVKFSTIKSAFSDPKAPQVSVNRPGLMKRLFSRRKGQPVVLCCQDTVLDKAMGGFGADPAQPCCRDRRAFLKWFSSDAPFLSTNCLRQFQESHPDTPAKGMGEYLLERLDLKGCHADLEAHWMAGCGCSEVEEKSWLELLGRVEGLKLRNFASSACCGGYAFRPLTDPEHAQRCAGPFKDELTAKSTVLTPSSECRLLFQKLGVTVLHPIELLSLE